MMMQCSKLMRSLLSSLQQKFFIYYYYYYYFNYGFLFLLDNRDRGVVIVGRVLKKEDRR